MRQHELKESGNLVYRGGISHILYRRRTSFFHGFVSPAFHQTTWNLHLKVFFRMEIEDGLCSKTKT